VVDALERSYFANLGSGSPAIGKTFSKLAEKLGC
jgi:hypothetical protein